MGNASVCQGGTIRPAEFDINMIEMSPMRHSVSNSLLVASASLIALGAGLAWWGTRRPQVASCKTSAGPKARASGFRCYLDRNAGAPETLAPATSARGLPQPRPGPA